MVSRARSWSGVPSPVRDVAARLDGAGHAVWLTGEGLFDLLRGTRPTSWVLATNASAEDVVGLLERAVPVRAAGAAFVVPTAAGPVDVVRLLWGDTVEDDLAHSGLRVLALAAAWPDGDLVDPHGGALDIEAARVSAVGDPGVALAERPLIGLVAARLLAQCDLALDPTLADAMSAMPEALAQASPVAIRRELTALLLAPQAGRALSLLRETGFERGLGLRTSQTTACSVEAMPLARVPRLCALTAGSGGSALLIRLRFDPDVRGRVRQLLQYHPVERSLGGSRHTPLRRALRRLPEGALDCLIDLREAQLAGAGDGPEADAIRQTLHALRERIARLREEARQSAERPELIWHGRDVIRELEIDPGPRVGAALRYLKERVAENAELNEPGALRALLAEWRAGPGSDESDGRRDRGEEGGGSAR